MKIIEKLKIKSCDIGGSEGVTIAFLGDSVTQGCFELYKKENNRIETEFDKRYSYERYLFDILCILYPKATVNIINAGISGDTAPRGAARVERDVIRHQPDLTVVCYGLNDCGRGETGIETYLNGLSAIFEKLRAAGGEIIFMTPNMMATKVSTRLTDPDFIAVAERCVLLQKEYMDAYIAAAKRLCEERGVPVCDCYAIWKKLDESGVDTTDLLANRINHPSREMNRLFAAELARTMLFC